jgi:CRISPR-associated protein Cas1
MSISSLGRVVEVAEDGRYLAKDRGFLTVAAGGTEIGRVALDDITAVVATSPATSVSCALLADLAGRGIPFVLCGRNYAPAGMLWPIAGHHAQQRRIEKQTEAGRPLKKRLWSLVVAAKIRAQGAALDAAGLEGAGFAFLARQVKSGDPENLEAQAARRYWPLLMGPDFRRDAAADGANALLNYGYAVLRASTARAIVAAGLHPGLGIFHRHPHNAMPLADDLMEPFRPLVDGLVVALLREGRTEIFTRRQAVFGRGAACRSADRGRHEPAGNLYPPAGREPCRKFPKRQRASGISGAGRHAGGGRRRCRALSRRCRATASCGFWSCLIYQWAPRRSVGRRQNSGCGCWMKATR